MKKILHCSLLLVLLFFFSRTISMAQTAIPPSTGDGSSDNPYEISSLDNLYWIADQVNSGTTFTGIFFNQTTDIDASATSTWFGGEGWLPIGNSLAPFSGNYSGQGHIIDQLYISRFTDYNGFFGYTDNANIDNLELYNIQISGNEYTGGLVGKTFNSTINNCYCMSFISGLNYIGGLTGSNSGSIISGCYCTGIVSGASYVGGLAGENSFFNITNCYCTGNVSGSDNIGGLVGYNNSSTISGCYSTGSVSGAYNIGGLVGQNNYLVSNCFFNTETSGQSNGIGDDSNSQTVIGLSTAEMKNYTNYINAGWDFISETANGSFEIWGINPIENDGFPFLSRQGYNQVSYISTQAVSDIEPTKATANGTILNYGSPIITHYGVCWNTTGTPTTLNSKTDKGYASETGAFTSDITGLTPNTTYYLRAYSTNTVGTSYGEQVSFTTTQAIPSGTGTSEDPYLISNLAELYWMAHEISIQPLDNGTYFTGQYFKQTADIDAAATSTWFGGEGWMPIGYLDEVSGNYKDFGGIYDGQGHVVSNIFINRPAESCVGLFGTVTDGVVKNLGVTNLSVNAKLQSGGLVGYLYGASTLENCYTTGTITTIEGTVGGLLGMNDGNNIIRQCYSECNVTGQTYVAGLFGQGISDGAEVSNCYATGAITSTGDNALTAGLIAYAYGTISNCFATGSVSNSNGGCAGLIHTNYGNVSNCYASGAVTGKDICGGLIGSNGDGRVINNCYSTGPVTASDPSGINIGGFAGSNLGTISNSYTISQLTGSSSNMGGFVGKNAGSTAVVNSNCFWNSDIYSTGCGSNIGTFSATGKTTAEMQISFTFTSQGWSTSVWDFQDKNYPRLSYQVPATSTYQTDGNWSLATNWSDGLPGSITDVTIAANCAVDGNYTAENLTINSNRAITISPAKTLTVSDYLINNVDSSRLVLVSDGSGTGMLMNNSIGVQATIKQYLTKEQWHYMGLPVASLDSAYKAFQSCYVASISEDKALDGAGTGWDYLTKGDAMQKLKGYAVRYGWAAANSNKTNDTTVTFCGTLNTGDQTVNLDFTNDGSHGWNFISNPYPITIDWDNGITVTNTDDAIYVWNNGTYASYVGTTVINGQTNYLPPMQGFFVHANGAGASVAFSDASKTATPTAFKSATIAPLIRLAVSTNNFGDDEMVIRIHPAATWSFDSHFDAYKLKAVDSKVPQFYSVINDITYSINSIPEISKELQIPLEVLIKTTGEHKLVLKDLQNYNFDFPILIVNENGKLLANLEQEDYIFSGTDGETIKLILAFAIGTHSSNKLRNSNISLTTIGQNLVINHLNNVSSEVMVCDLSGRIIFRKKVVTNQLMIPVSRNGIYLVKILPENENIFKGKAIMNF